ncbi:DUF5348 domain-containing protein [Turicibacter sanguinis]|uniref:DUF5348 domain-containing protein n=1 Tax=Turicibacter sanguinis TaxID=154288 RepID=UPI0018A9A367|nr:DUF5348 domain-containing protein [Turicibacter sanguinis]
MIEVYLQPNEDSNEFDFYHAVNDEFIQTLTAGDSFMLISDEDDEEIPGRIQYHPLHGYYWINSEDSIKRKLTADMPRYI